ncbi:hypothetical protein [Saccharopolyspora taberi]|uniref:Minor tail protein n=1 Tax=Saccharopolyspora taberi TaxID=60895 RepID=A0ABN3UZS9_9PSEU
MLAHTPAAAAAITARERYFRPRLLIDWNRDGAFDHELSDLSRFVRTGEREHALSSTVPEEIMLVEGEAAASLPLTLAGELNGEPLAYWFAATNPDGPFFGQLPEGTPMRFDIGVWTDAGWEDFRQITGIVRDITADRDTGEVHIECLDHVELTRGPVNLAPSGILQRALQQGVKRGGLTDSAAIIDLCARAGGFTMGPPKRWAWWQGQESGTAFGPVLSVPFHGSVIPEVGTLDNDQTYQRTEEWETSANSATRARAEAYRDGPHGYLAHEASPVGVTPVYHKYWVDEQDRGVAGTMQATWVMGAWVHWPGNNVNADSAPITLQIRKNRMQIVIENSNGGVAPRLIDQAGGVGTGPYLFMVAGWNYVEARFLPNSSTQITMQMRVNSTVSAEQILTGRNAPNLTDPLSGLVTIDHTYAVSDVYVVQVAGATWFGNFSYDTAPAGTAVISAGNNRLTHTLRQTGREAWALAKEIAAAEFGCVFFDEQGRFTFWTLDDVLDRQTGVVRRFTVDDFTGLRLRSTVDSIRNVWTVTTTSGRAVSGIAYDLASDGVPLYRAASGELLPVDFVVAAGTALETFIPTGDAIIAVEPFNLPVIPENGFWDSEVPFAGRKPYTGTDYREGTTGDTEQKFISRDLARLWVWNGWDEPIGHVDPNGASRFRIQGTVVAEDAAKTWTVRNTESIALAGERVIELTGNTWQQDEWVMRVLLERLVARLGRPIPVSDTITVPGDPRVQIGDTIEVADAAGFGPRIWLQIYGIRRVFDADAGLTDTYTVEMIQPPGASKWDGTTPADRWDYGYWS